MIPLYILQGIDKTNVKDKYFDNSKIDGLSIRGSWKHVDLYGWDYIYSQIERVEQKDKKFQLRLLGGIKHSPDRFSNLPKSVVNEGYIRGWLRFIRSVPKDIREHNKLTHVHVAGINDSSAELHLKELKGVVKPDEVISSWMRCYRVYSKRFKNVTLSSNISNCFNNRDGVPEELIERLKSQPFASRIVLQHNAKNGSNQKSWRIEKLVRYSGFTFAFQQVRPSSNKTFKGHIENFIEHADGASMLEIYQGDSRIIGNYNV